MDYTTILRESVLNGRFSLLTFINDSLGSVYKKVTYDDWAQRIRITCDNGSGGLAYLFFTNGIVSLYTAGNKIIPQVVHNLFTGEDDITFEVDGRAVTVTKTLANSTWGLLPMVGNWSIYEVLDSEQ